MTKLQNLLIKISRRPSNIPVFKYDNPSIVELQEILILKTWIIYRKEIDGVEYPLSETESEEYIFLPNHKAHHQSPRKPGVVVAEDVIHWDLYKAFSLTGSGTVLFLNGVECRIITMSENSMVWLVNGTFVYLRPAWQRSPSL